MKKLLIIAVALLALAGCGEVNGVDNKVFTKSCYNKGGVPFVLREGDVHESVAQFCIKKDAILDYNTEQ